LWRPFWKWRPVEIFQCRDIIMYPHIKFWWYRTMLNFWKWQTSWKFWRHRIAPLMVIYHYVKFYVSIIIHLEVININVRNFNFPIGFYSKLHPIWTPQNMTLTPFTTKLKTLGPTRNIYLQLHKVSWDLLWTRSCRKERKENTLIIIVIIIIRMFPTKFQFIWLRVFRGED
jgi:hypothetical protein